MLCFEKITFLMTELMALGAEDSRNFRAEEF